MRRFPHEIPHEIKEFAKRACGSNAAARRTRCRCDPATKRIDDPALRPLAGGTLVGNLGRTESVMKNSKKPQDPQGRQDQTAEQASERGNEPQDAGAQVATGIVKLGESPEITASPSEHLKHLAAGHGVQALWAALLPLLGVGPASPGEFPGLFQVERGPGKDEAMIHIDIPDKPYEQGKAPSMDRVVTLTVRMQHDFRKFGNRYYCIDCESPSNETRH